jgi:hypothetical protein
MIRLSNKLANTFNAKIYNHELISLINNKKSDPIDRPYTNVLCSENLRSKLRCTGDIDEFYVFYLMIFDKRFNLARNLFIDLAPKSDEIILDVGTGCGYLVYILKKNGFKNIDTFDIPDTPTTFNENCRVLEVQKKSFVIEKGKNIRDFGRKYDIIVCGLIQFDNHSNNAMGDEWGPASWKYFLQDISDNQLTDRGFIFLNFDDHHGISLFEKNKSEAIYMYNIFKKYSVPIRLPQEVVK